MPERQLCCNAWGKAKISYKTRAAAEKAARRTKSEKAIHVYHCLYGEHFHLTSKEQYGKPTPLLSFAKLRRKLAANAALVKSAQERLEAAEEIMQRARAHAADEIECIAKLVKNWRQ